MDNSGTNPSYRAFGLTFSSELPLPGLPATSDQPEIRIRRTSIPEWSGDATIQKGERLWIRGQEWLVRFQALPFAGLIRDGKLIEFQADPAQDDLASLHVLGSCAGALLFQRGMVPLHGNSVATRHGAVMLAGKIGAGKSATTFALLQRGHRLIADDISAVSFDPAGLRVMPGFPRLKLWRSTLEHFDRDCRAFQSLRPGTDKYHYPVDDTFCPEPQALKSIYILQASDSPVVSVRALSGVAKLEALRPHLYKLRFRDAIRNWPALLDKMCRLADSLRINVIERPREGVSIDAVADAIEKDLTRISARG